jgi:hypothetical protein
MTDHQASISERQALILRILVGLATFFALGICHTGIWKQKCCTKWRHTCHHLLAVACGSVVVLASRFFSKDYDPPFFLVFPLGLTQVLLCWAVLTQKTKGLPVLQKSLEVVCSAVLFVIEISLFYWVGIGLPLVDAHLLTVVQRFYHHDAQIEEDPRLGPNAPLVPNGENDLN